MAEAFAASVVMGAGFAAGLTLWAAFMLLCCLMVIWWIAR